MHGGGKKYWIESGAKPLGEGVDTVELYWLYHSDYMNPNTYCLWSCNNQLYVKNITVTSVSIRRDDASSV